MSTDVIVRKLNKEVRELRGEVRHMQDVLVQVMGDNEGEYQRAFVKKVFAREKEKPLFRYATPAAFLKHVGKK